MSDAPARYPEPMTAPMPHDLTTHRVALDTLRPHPDNPRNGDVDAIAESLRVNGLFRPLVVGRNGTILAGNHTYHAALASGWTEIDVVLLDVDAHSPAGKRIVLADNRTSDLATYDEGLLATMLQSLQDEDGGLEGIGYSEDDLEKLLASISKPLDLPDDVEGETPGGDVEPRDVKCPSCGHEFTA